MIMTLECAAAAHCGGTLAQETVEELILPQVYVVVVVVVRSHVDLLN